MSPPKETTMVLNVDLGCACCYRKVKKLLCSFPQIKDQIYNEKQNAVMIKVVCCSPEKIRDKLCCKGRKSIRSIEIIEPKKPEPTPTRAPKPTPTPAPKPTPTPAPKPTPTPAPKPAPALEPIRPYPVNDCCSDCYNGRNTGPCYGGYGVPPAPIPPYPVNVCCSDCYNGRNTGPCYGGHGVPPPAGGWCCNYPAGGYNYGYGYGYGYGYNYQPGYCVSRCGENPTACVIM